MAHAIHVDSGEIRSHVASARSDVTNISPRTPTVENAKILQIENLMVLHERLNGITETLKCIIDYDMERMLGFTLNREIEDAQSAETFGDW